MKKDKSAQRWDDLANEKMSANDLTAACQQCRTCAFWNGGTPDSNEPYKTNCQMYEAPGFKPLDVIRNTGECPFYLKDARGSKGAA